jgi:hypothetical protein
MTSRAVLAYTTTGTHRFLHNYPDQKKFMDSLPYHLIKGGGFNSGAEVSQKRQYTTSRRTLKDSSPFSGLMTFDIPEPS